MRDMQDSVSICPGCGLHLPKVDGPLHPGIAASAECLQLCNELSYYTLSKQDPFFIHQIAVDAYAAQHAGEETKPITVAFALIGLYFVCELGRTGRDAQLEHIRLANISKVWPHFSLPAHRGSITVADVLTAKPGEDRDIALKEWAASVWESWKHEHARVAEVCNI